MKIPATVLMLLISGQLAAADFAARVAAGRAPPSSSEAGAFYAEVMNNTVVPIMRRCAPPGANTAAEDWVLTLVGTVSTSGKIDDIEVQPVNAITTCLVEQLKAAAPRTPPAGIASTNGLPLLVELRMTNRNAPRPASTITPVFSQLVAYTLPQGFTPAFQSTTVAHHIQESVLQGENIENWSQMITLSGARDQAVDPAATPLQFVQRIANRFVDACPGTFSNKLFDPMKIDGHDAVVAVLGCGALRTRTPWSEITLVIAIKGRSDMYTLQWAERGEPTRQSPVLDEARWTARFQQLGPIRLCNPVPGEAAPFPSCTGGAAP